MFLTMLASVLNMDFTLNRRLKTLCCCSACRPARCEAETVVCVFVIGNGPVLGDTLFFATVFTLEGEILIATATDMGIWLYADDSVAVDLNRKLAVVVSCLCCVGFFGCCYEIRKAGMTLCNHFLSLQTEK